MIRPHSLVALSAWLCLTACGDVVDRGSEGEPDAGFTSRELRSLHACVTRYFEEGQYAVRDGSEQPGWTIAVMDHPEIAARVTGGDGCTDIPLPSPADLLVSSTQPGWVSMAATVRVRSGDLPRMEPVILQSFAAVEPWWWQWTDMAGGTTGSGGLTGMVALAIYDRSRSLSDAGERVLIPGITAKLHENADVPRENWAYVDPSRPTYCNEPNSPNPPCPPTGFGIMSRVPPGTWIVELPGLSCPVGEEESSFTWPVEGTADQILVDVRANYVTSVSALCDLEEP